jgi:mannitol/fructose-specific phosphotransferase system IIA component (Ntr-type)
MRSLLDALKEGRLVELPDGYDKTHALELLAHLIEAIPDIGSKDDLMEGVMAREAQANTGIGRGVACPHCRVSSEGELLCAVGWSPAGIDYGSPDGKHVHLIVMYYVPDSERNAYLKEISGLAKAIGSGEGIEGISSLPDLHRVREKLLDWVSLAINEAMPETKARMIKLEARQAVAAQGGSLAGAALPAAAAFAADLRILPLRVVAWPEGAVILCRDAVLSEALEKVADLGARLGGGLAQGLPLGGVREFDAAGYRIAVLSETLFERGRREYEAVAILLPGS